ncbi:MAG: peptidoglycan bridge formation glycyltransferase FemA/FemB family protein [Desulfatiglans sp.]|jgi:lipid II:glycine glycyltransferase (peptidoglycan interpeptide bridge formation enzyme)|nr:peptidoglycan bridge formation glycyltransferase FemA/FemB family protein [Desulfatiglans sp.]
MNIELIPKRSNELIPTDILYQTGYWGQVKKWLGWRPLAFDLALRDRFGDILVLTKDIGSNISAAYIPQGPEHGPEPEKYGLFLEELSEKLLRHLGTETAFIRYDLPWSDQYYEQEGNHSSENVFINRPESRLRELRMNYGTTRWNIRKAAFDLTVADTVLVDLTEDTERIYARMKSKTRYNTGLSKRKGVRVFKASILKLAEFYELYRQTAERNRFTVCDYNKFYALFMALDCDPHSPEIYFLLAEHEGDILAGAIVAISGTTATYLFGASANHKRNLMASYAVQWDAILLAKSRGCLTYDMGAIPPSNDPKHPFYGMYRFKSGFGGYIVHRAGTWDYPVKGAEYKRFRSIETMDQVKGF